MARRTPMDALARRHLVFGWWCLLGFLTIGIGLELMHGFKIGWYLDVANESRRLMLRLGHGHGSLLALVNIGFALTLSARDAGNRPWKRLASRCLIAASLLLPGGFLAGGLVVYGGDPNPAILGVPIGGALLLVAVGTTAWGVTEGGA